MGYCCPLDISSASGSVIRFVGSMNILSVRIEYSSNICANVSCGQASSNNIGCGIKVHAYTGLNATGTLLGNVNYGHLNQRLPADGSVINRPFPQTWSVALGYVPAVPGITQGCYLSTHVHTSIYGNGKARAALTCGAGVVGSTTVVYTWTV
ncbi:MAG: hypothetical protein ACREOB_09775 [Thermodesulfobacteriota bacterium]